MHPHAHPLYVAAACCCCVAAASAAELTVEKTDRGVTIKADGELFAEYLIKSGHQPVVWPLIGPTGKSVTRAYPLQEASGESKDHEHHRSLWFNHGDVNGVDFWKEGGGQIQHREFVTVEGGSEAKLVTRNDWLSPQGVKQCEDERHLSFRVEDDRRIIDFEVVVKASASEVKLGDTKEGSFGIRVADTINVDAKKGGRIVNSEGQKDDKAWGKPAAWVDYHGPLDGKTVGIAILNHPSSFGYPTHWHVRTYGLFAANPFGLKDFGRPASGSHTIAPGESLTLRYRIILHPGDEKQGQIAQAFESYSNQDKR